MGERKCGCGLMPFVGCDRHAIPESQPQQDGPIPERHRGEYDDLVGVKRTSEPGDTWYAETCYQIELIEELGRAEAALMQTESHYLDAKELIQKMMKREMELEAALTLAREEARILATEQAVAQLRLCSNHSGGKGFGWFNRWLEWTEREITALAPRAALASTQPGKTGVEG